MEMEVGGISVSDGEGCEESQTSNNGSTGDATGNNISSSGSGKLKRSSSAPMINQLLPQANVTTVTTSTSNSSVDSLGHRDTNIINVQPRARRSSANFGPVSPLSPGSVGRSMGRMRVCQLREEEGMDVVNREAAHERTLHSTLQVSHTLSQSWEDLSVSDDRKSPSVPAWGSSGRRDLSDQLSLTIGGVPTSPTPPIPCSASPTRATIGRQCFSPALQQPVRNYTFGAASPAAASPGSSPSPTKKTFTSRRSLSPVPLRPSPLGPIKRKWDHRDQMDDTFATPTKRLSIGTSTPASSDRGGLLIANPHSLDRSHSPAGGGSVTSSAANTPDSFSHDSTTPDSYSPNPPTPEQLPPPHLFKPLSPPANPMLRKDLQSSGISTNISSSRLSTESNPSDAMVTETTPSTEMKGYQAMELGEALSHSNCDI